MQQPPSPALWLRYPITACVAVLAIVAAIQSSAGQNINPVFLSDTGDCLREPWRLLTSALFHLGPIHLIFNLYWLWVFGTFIEDRFGHGATLAIFCLFAAGSMAAELAIFRGGVGLSGVGYGLFGLLWVLSRRDPRFRDAVDSQTIQLMVGWFFLCIALTVTDVWRVANVAHGVGCVLGILLGWTIAARGVATRAWRGAIVAMVFVLCIAGGTVARSYVNLTDDVGRDFAYRGYQALLHRDYQQAATLYEKAVAIDSHQHGWWNNLGIAYYHLDRAAEAQDALNRADALKPEGDESK
jgi:membrane associated rhomboid family serine protease